MLSQTSEYALRAVSYLAKQHPQMLTVTEIASAGDIPSAYLVKVLQALAREKIVVSQRGNGGGIRLARALDQITMLDVINAVDPITRITSCPLGLAKHRHRLCPVHSRMDRAFEMLEQTFSEATIAQLLSEDSMDQKRCPFPNIRISKR